MLAPAMVAYENKRLESLKTSTNIAIANFTIPVKSEDFVFFNNFNIYRGNKTNRLYTDDLNSIQTIRQEFIRSTNVS